MHANHVGHEGRPDVVGSDDPEIPSGFTWVVTVGHSQVP